MNTFTYRGYESIRTNFGNYRLAWAEIYHMAAQVAFRIIPRARLYETTIEDISYDHDCIVVQTKKGSISVRIKIE